MKRHVLRLHIRYQSLKPTLVNWGFIGILLLRNASGLLGLGEIRPGVREGVRSDHTLDTCWSVINIHVHFYAKPHII